MPTFKKGVPITTTPPAGGAIEVTVTPTTLIIACKAQSPVAARVLLAITEDELTSDVKAGENGGRTLRHSAVVRSLASVGEMKAGACSIETKATLNSGWKLEKLHAVAIAQADDGKILGAATVTLAQFPK